MASYVRVRHCFISIISLVINKANSPLFVVRKSVPGATSKLHLLFKWQKKEREKFREIMSHFFFYNKYTIIILFTIDKHSKV